jgi:formamidopyrimidine-DNA glycosylase
MPELPEVEVTRCTLDPVLRGARVLQARLGKPLRWPLGVSADWLVGREIGALQRRGKYIWLPLGPRPGDCADDAGGLLMHLGMSGSLSISQTPPPAGPHDHFELHTTHGVMRLRDPRRFGAVVWSAGLAEEPARTRLAGLGAEPFDPALTPQRFHAELSRRRVAIKPLLLHGDIVVGAGNIYACEALFHAGIAPQARADRISRPRAARLLQALRQTLEQALALGGSSLRDFKDVHGLDGAYQASAAVYGRDGLPCLRCAAPVRRMVQAQRSTYWCTRCQRR